MKLTVDLALIIGIAICYVAGQFVAAYEFAMIAGVLLAVFVVRLIGGALAWVLTGGSGQ